MTIPRGHTSFPRYRVVIPAEAGIQSSLGVIPAKAGIHFQALPGHPGSMKDGKLPCVYLLASKRRGTLYVGVTSELAKRVWEHKTDLVDGFTKRHGIHMLVYYESCEDMNAAISGEKQLKRWNRVWKIRMIEERNPEWNDLYSEIM